MVVVSLIRLGFEGNKKNSWLKVVGIHKFLGQLDLIKIKGS